MRYKKKKCAAHKGINFSSTTCEGSHKDPYVHAEKHSAHRMN